MTKQSGHSGIRKALFFAGTSAGILLFLLTGIFFRAAQTEDSEKTSGPAAGKKERSAGKAANSVFNCQYDNLHLGIPGKTDCLIDRYGFALGYSEKHEQALFVVYLLTAEKLEHKIAERGNRFLSDPEIPTGSADDQDYKRSGYDRGHLAPAADMVFSQEAMKNSFYYSNISPQAPGFNRGIWKKLEEQVRFFARTEKKNLCCQRPRI